MGNTYHGYDGHGLIPISGALLLYSKDKQTVGVKCLLRVVFRGVYCSTALPLMTCLELH
jgi:hypothetical protein